ncbi:hypothetical protein DYB32_004972 [Aphanomyces invadans]|uniref:Uncharacterized protein n=1 Tax=Aphanomyces invadans TaxID=157072 RepID=A0A418AW01_9STRA|nr:hypothetical protein DYB32_004972 [Aphanomyces invadans]
MSLSVHIAKAIDSIGIFLSVVCAVLMVVDLIGNNWELNDFVGNAKHFTTPLLDARTRDRVSSLYAFPDHASPTAISPVGQFMLDMALEHVHNPEKFYLLTMSSYEIQDKANDICGRLTGSYPVDTAVNDTVRIGTIRDEVTFVRGTALSHLLGTTRSSPPAAVGATVATLEAMGYEPARVGLDMRFTTAFQVDASEQVVALNVTMYRLYSKAFCSGCRPNTELGMVTCEIEYSYNAATKRVEIASSRAHFGLRHKAGIIMTRRLGPIVSLWVRILTVLMAFGTFTMSKKSVRWTDALTLTKWRTRLMHMVAPPLYRSASHAMGFVYFCANSDVVVLAFSGATLFDEDVAMVYARVATNWYSNAPFDLWMELRLRALSIRWLWFNLALLKLVKCLCNLVSVHRTNGANVVMGWLNFSSIPWIYTTVGAVFLRTDFIEYGNSVRVDVTANQHNIESVYVEFESSWYMRGMPSLICLLLGNLLLVLGINHIVLRKWWRVVANNSLARQHMYNSTSIVLNKELMIEAEGLHSIVAIPAAELSTIQWFFSSHLVCFGLPEDPAAIRRLVSTKVGTTIVTTTSIGAGTSISPLVRGETRGKLRVSPSKDNILQCKVQPASTKDVTDKKAGTADTMEFHFLVQDRDGCLRLYDGDKREIQSIGIESKVVKGAVLQLG